MLRRLAKAAVGEVPGGPYADAELLRQMAAERAGVRPAVLSKDTVEALEEFRCLWHLVVDGRSPELDPSGLAAPVERLEAVARRVRDEVLRFVTFLERSEYESEKPTGAADGKAPVGPASARRDQCARASGASRRS